LMEIGTAKLDALGVDRDVGLVVGRAIDQERRKTKQERMSCLVTSLSISQRACHAVVG